MRVSPRISALLLVGALSACGTGAQPATAPSPGPTTAAPTPAAAQPTAFRAAGFNVTFPSAPQHVVQRANGVTLDLWGVAKDHVNRSVLVMRPLPVKAGSERAQLTTATKRYWATYHAAVAVDPKPLEVSGSPAIEFEAAGDGQAVHGVAVARGDTAYLVFYLAPQTGFDMNEAFAFTDGFGLTTP